MRLAQFDVDPEGNEQPDKVALMPNLVSAIVHFTSIGKTALVILGAPGDQSSGQNFKKLNMSYEEAVAEVNAALVS